MWMSATWPVPTFSRSRCQKPVETVSLSMPGLTLVKSSVSAPNLLDVD